MAACYWQWKSDLAKPDTDASAWTAYSSKDSETIEKANKAGKKEIKLNANYAVSIKELFQYSLADPNKQRAVRRKLEKRPAEEEEDGPGPAKKVAKKSGAIGSAVNYEQLDPSKTDLQAEAQRRSEMPRPSQDDLVFFWYGQYFRNQSDPKRAVVNPTGAVQIKDSYKSVVACCQRTDKDTYDLEMQTKHVDIGFVQPEDFGDWFAFPWLTFMGKSVTLSEAGAAKMLWNDVSKGCQIQLQITSEKLTVKGGGQTLEFPMSNPLKETAVLAFWMYANKDVVKIL